MGLNLASMILIIDGIVFSRVAGGQENGKGWAREKGNLGGSGATGFAPSPWPRGCGDGRREGCDGAGGCDWSRGRDLWSRGYLVSHRDPRGESALAEFEMSVPSRVKFADRNISKRWRLTSLCLVRRPPLLRLLDSLILHAKLTSRHNSTEPKCQHSA